MSSSRRESDAGPEGEDNRFKAGADGSEPQGIQGIMTPHYQGYKALELSQHSPFTIGGPEKSRDTERAHS